MLLNTIPEQDDKTQEKAIRDVLRKNAVLHRQALFGEITADEAFAKTRALEDTFSKKYGIWVYQTATGKIFYGLLVPSDPDELDYAKKAGIDIKKVYVQLTKLAEKELANRK